MLAFQSILRWDCSTSSAKAHYWVSVVTLRDSLFSANIWQFSLFCCLNWSMQLGKLYHKDILNTSSRIILYLKTINNRTKTLCSPCRNYQTRDCRVSQPLLISPSCSIWPLIPQDPTPHNCSGKCSECPRVSNILYKVTPGPRALQCVAQKLPKPSFFSLNMVTKSLAGWFPSQILLNKNLAHLSKELILGSGYWVLYWCLFLFS